MVRKKPLQQISVSSLHMQAPQQSPFLFSCLLMSQTMKAEKTEILVRYSMRTPMPAKKQKLERASSDEVQPRKKAMAFVNDVIVMDEPACRSPIIILFSTGSRGSVWSMFDEITNMSSTPIPMSKNGSRLWIPAVFPPTRKHKPFEAPKERPTQRRVIPAAADRK